MSLKNTSYFNPTSITGCTLWLDGADPAGNGVIPANGTSITSWIDKSLSGNTCSNASSANSPVLFSSILNGKPVLSFTGPAVLNTTTSQWLDNTVMTFPNTTNTIFALVFNNNSTTKSFTANNYIISGRADALISYSSYSGNNFATFVGSGSGWNDLNTNTPSQNMNGVWAITGMSQNSSTLTPYYNGLVLNTKSGTMGSTTGFIIGDAPSGYRGQCWNGYMAEIIMFRIVLGTTQRQQIEGYLAWKWGLTASLPSSHPYAVTPSYGLPLLVPNAPAKTSITYANHPVVAIGGCALWFDGADPLGTGNAPENGTSLTTWVNKGITTVTLAHGTSQPTYSANFQNGLGSVSFNNNYFSAAYSFNLQTKSAFIVCSQSNNATDSPQGILSFYGSGLDTVNSTNGYGYQATQGGYGSFGWLYNIFAGGATGYYIATGTAGANTPMGIYGNVFSNQFEQTFKDGSSVTNFTITTTPGTSTNLMVGARLIGGGLRGSFFGNICEIIVYNIALSASQRQTIEGYLAQKWGLTANLPVGHPHKSSFPLYPSPVTGVRAMANKRWSPTSVGNCGFWFDAADTNSITTSSSSNISSWSNKAFSISGFPNAVTGTNVVYTNGAKINGLNTILVNSGASLSIASFTVPTASFTAFFVVKGVAPLAGSQAGYFLWNPTTSSFNDFTIYNVPSFANTYFFLYELRSTGAALSYFPTVDSFYTNAAIGSLIGNGTANTGGFVNGNQVTTTSNFVGNPTGATGAMSYTIGTMGRNDERAYNLGEMMIYYSVLGDTQRQQAEGYLAWKWGLRDSLPSSHPYKLFPPSP